MPIPSLWISAMQAFRPLLRTVRAWQLAMLWLLVLCSGAAMATSRELTVTAPDGVTLAVQDQGPVDAPALVLVHGLLGSRLSWSGQIDSPALSRYRIITYDLRGHGLSGKPTEAQAYQDGGRWADDLAAVLQATGARNATLVGWSLGATVISNYLSKYGDKGLSGAVYVAGVVDLKPDLIVPHPAVYQELVSTDLNTHLGALQTFLGLCFATRPEEPIFGRLVANAAMASWDMQRSVQGMSVDLGGFGRTRLPTLMLYGARDALVDTDATVRRARELQPGTHVLIYPGSGHAPFIEERNRFNRDLAAFLEKVNR